MMLDIHINIAIVMHTCARNIVSGLSVQHGDALSRNVLFINRRNADTLAVGEAEETLERFVVTLGALIRRRRSDKEGKLSR